MLQLLYLMFLKLHAINSQPTIIETNYDRNPLWCVLTTVAPQGFKGVGTESKKKFEIDISENL